MVVFFPTPNFCPRSNSFFFPLFFSGYSKGAVSPSGSEFFFFLNGRDFFFSLSFMETAPERNCLICTSFSLPNLLVFLGKIRFFVVGSFSPPDETFTPTEICGSPWSPPFPAFFFVRIFGLLPFDFRTYGIAVVLPLLCGSSFFP